MYIGIFYCSYFRHHFGAGRCQKYALYPKKIQIKVVKHWILYKKVSGRIRLSPSRMELGGFKDCHLLKSYNVQKWGSRITLGLDSAENMHYIQKCFKKKKRKSRSRGLLMFSNVFQELSISPSAVNSFKVTNLCKNGIHIRKI